MKALLAGLLFTLILSSTLPGENKAEMAARESANHWLSLVDEGRYAGPARVDLLYSRV